MAIMPIYKERFDQYGENVKSLWWGSNESQEKRFQILKEIGINIGDAILDVGCGFGDFYKYLIWCRSDKFVEDNLKKSYTGIEIQKEYYDIAKKNHPDVEFWNDDIMNVSILFDWVIASGIFSLLFDDMGIKFGKIIEKMWSLCIKGVAFNMLSCHSPYKKDPRFYYADPLEWMDEALCITQKAVLRHDYLKNDFTIYMYRE